MPDYKALYFKLFAAAADALDALERNDGLQARQILLRAQLEAEERWISSEKEAHKEQ